MEYGPDLIASSHSGAAAVALRRKRQHHRHQVNSLAYVNIGQGNGGIIRDLAESGDAVQAVAPLQVNQQWQLRSELVSPAVRVGGARADTASSTRKHRAASERL